MADGPTSLLELVSAGFGISLLPDLFQRFLQMCFRPLPPNTPKLQLSLAWRPTMIAIAQGISGNSECSLVKPNHERPPRDSLAPLCCRSKTRHHVLSFNIISMLELEAALERILALIPPANRSALNFGHAHRRILAQRILSPVDLPAFDNSAWMAMRPRGDVQEQALIRRYRCNCAGRVAAEKCFPASWSWQLCATVHRLAAARGADAVVMQKTRGSMPPNPVRFLFLDAASPGKCAVSRRGFEMRAARGKRAMN